jgi:predicted deacylase
MTAVTRRTISYAAQADGTPLTFPVIEITGTAGPTLLFTGGIHGDEYEGPLALLDLARRLAEMPLRGRVLILPFVNGPALQAGTRLSPLDSANLARIFPGDPSGGTSARLAAAVWALLDGVDAVVDSHSGGTELCFLPVAGFYAAADGVPDVAARASRRLAEATGLPHLWQLPPQAGVLSHEAARRGIPVTGCEVGGRGHAAAADVTIYRDSYLRVLASQGMVDGPVATAAQGVWQGNWTVSPASGLYRPLLPLGSAVATGTAIARIETPDGAVMADLMAPHDGLLLAERNLCRIREGDLAIFVASRAA